MTEQVDSIACVSSWAAIRPFNYWRQLDSYNSVQNLFATPLTPETEATGLV